MLKSIFALGLFFSSSVLAQGIPFRQLSEKCSPSVDESTMEALVRYESNGTPLAINVNGGYTLPRQPATYQEAVSTANWLDKHGYNYDIGLGQINSQNFKFLGSTAALLFDPCNNLKASAIILTNCYQQALSHHFFEQESLYHALSCYNTGSLSRGMDHYVPGLIRQFQIAQNEHQELHIPALMAPPFIQTILPEAKPELQNKAKINDSSIKHKELLSSEPPSDLNGASSIDEAPPLDEQNNNSKNATKNPA